MFVGVCKSCGRSVTAAEMGAPCPECGGLDRIVLGVDGGNGIDREAVGRGVADRHYEIEPGLTHIYWIRSSIEEETSPTEPIKLLEVNENTIPSEMEATPSQ